MIEKDCTFTHEGKSYTAGGAVVNDAICMAYVGKDGILTDWHGNPLGTYVIVSSWPIHSYISNEMYAIHATIDGKLYKGRGCGVGMVFNGKRSKKESE